jgi:hypothetical protein
MTADRLWSWATAGIDQLGQKEAGANWRMSYRPMPRATAKNISVKKQTGPRHTEYAGYGRRHTEYACYD